MKRKGRNLALVALTVVLIISLTVPVHATGWGGGGRGDFGGAFWPVIDWGTRVDLSESNNEYNQLLGKVWSQPAGISGTLSVSYDILSDLCVELNMSGYPCHIARSNTAYRIVGDGYILNESSRQNIDGRYLCTTNAEVLEANINTNSLLIFQDIRTLLDNIRVHLSNLYDRVAHIDNALTQSGGLFDLWFSLFNERMKYIGTGIDLINANLEDLSITGNVNFDTTPITNKLDEVIAALDTTPITTKLDEVSTSIKSTIIDAADRSKIISQLSAIVSQLQYGGAAPSGTWHPTTIYDYVQGIYNNMGTGGSGGGGISDGSLIYNAIKDFQVDFDDTFSDLKQIYPTEKVEQISSGSFEWNNGIDILNSVTASDKLSTTAIYRLPETTMNVTENNGTFRIDNDGSALPVSVNFSYDGASHGVSTYGVNETKTVTGTDIVITDAYGTTPLSLQLFGRSTQNGTPSPSNPVPVYGGLEDAEPYVYMYKGSDDSYKWHIYADFESQGIQTPLHGIPVSSGGNYTDETGRQWLCDVVDFNGGTYTQNIGVITLDGSADEPWAFSGTSASNPYFLYAPGNVDPMSATRHEVLCDRFPYEWLVDLAAYDTRGVYYSLLGDGTSGFVFGVGSLVGSDAEWRTWLAANPVTVYYPLPEPVVYEAFEVYGNGALDSSYTRINMGDFVSLPIRVTYTVGNPYTALYSDADGNWYKQRNDGSSVQITDSRVDTLNAAFNYKEYDNAADIKFNAGTNIIEVSNGELTIDYIKGSKFFNWLYLYLTNFNTGGLGDVLDRMDTIVELLSGSVGSGSCEHTYAAEVNQEASCALPGLQTFTCSNCGSSYSEIISSTGHDWQCTDHVADELDPETGEVISSGYDIYTCSICQETYNDYDGSGAPDTQSDTVTGIISRVFEKLGTLAGDLIAMVIRMLDKLLTGFDDLVTDFNTKTEQITGFGGDYPLWLAGVWEIIPEDLMLALGFCVVVGILAIIGKKLVFS